MNLILTQTACTVQDEFLSTGTLLATGLIVTLGVIVFVEYFADRQPSGRRSPSKSEMRGKKRSKSGGGGKGESGVPLPVKIVEGVKNTPRSEKDLLQSMNCLIYFPKRS